MADKNVLKIALPIENGDRAVLDISKIKTDFDNNNKELVKRIEALESGDFQYAYKDYTQEAAQAEMVVGTTFLVPQTEGNEFVELDPATNKPKEPSKQIHHFIPCTKDSAGKVTQGAPIYTQANIKDVAYTNKANTFEEVQTLKKGAKKTSTTDWATLTDHDLVSKSEVNAETSKIDANLKKLTAVTGETAEHVALKNAENTFTKDQIIQSAKASGEGAQPESGKLKFESQNYTHSTGALENEVNAVKQGVEFVDKAKKSVAEIGANISEQGVTAQLVVHNADNTSTDGIKVEYDKATKKFKATAPETEDTAQNNEIVTANWAKKKIDEVKTSIQDATDKVKGVVTLSDNVGDEDAATGKKAVTPKALKTVKEGVEGKIGDLNSLKTTEKTNVVGALNEIHDKLGSSTLEGLTDTEITAPKAGQVLRYGTDKWKNAELVSIEATPQDDQLEAGVLYFESGDDAGVNNPLQDGTINRKGLIQLTNDMDEANQTLAMTPKGVADALKKAGLQPQGNIPRKGDRGELGGFEQVEDKGSQNGGTITISKDSRDVVKMSTTGSVTLSFEKALENVTTTKVIALKAEGVTTLTVNGATWVNGATAPTWGNQGKKLILVANFIMGEVFISVFHNDQ